MQTLEQALVDAFIVPRKRDRYRSFLANEKRRAKILDELNHLHDLDHRYATNVPSGTDVVALLRAHGAPRKCHVISDITALDGREMLLEDAVREAEQGIWGTLLGCIPGRLAFYFGEAGEQHVLLERGS